MGVNRTPMSIVMDVWIGPELPGSILSDSIYYVPESKIWVKIYDLLNFLTAFVVHFRVSRYIMGLNHTTVSKVTIVWICVELLYSILTGSIYYVPESDIRVKSYSHLNFSRASSVKFRASRYIMGVDHAFESNVMAVWICRENSFSISRVSIYYACESDIRVKSYSHLNFSRASVVQFWASRYIMGVDNPFESKVMAVWISQELPWSILRVSTYDARESDIRVKSYSHLSFSSASVVQFWASRYIMGVVHTFESKAMPVWIFRELLWSISSVSIYYWPKSNIQVKR